MSIDAVVKEVVRDPETGSGVLHLGGQNRGQERLRFDRSPRDVFLLRGLDIWGGSDCIMLGETKIAERIGYVRIKFVVVDIKEAMCRK